jgi:hypothetical protein
MRTAQELIEKITRQGGKISIFGETVEIDAPKGVVTPKLRNELVAHKTEILALQLWRHELVRIPRIDGEGVDVWAVIRRIDDPSRWCTWFLRTEKAR